MEYLQYRMQLNPKIPVFTLDRNYENLRIKILTISSLLGK
jgi:hypothetical protein